MWVPDSAAELEREGSPDEGYLVVIVPQSARAPHQIVLRGKHEGRYYGRDATGNRILTQLEVEHIYARRARWEADTLAEAEEALRARSSAAYSSSPERVFLLLRGSAGTPTTSPPSTRRGARRSSR